MSGIDVKSLQPTRHQLRAPVADFVGRKQEIDYLVRTLSKGAGSGTTATISGVRGMGGIGKTELAYVVAHELMDAFPDSQVLVELRGASNHSLTPEQALQTVINAFDRETKLPDDLFQLQAIYRSVLTGKQALIVADDAKDAAQVRPLMPPPGSALLVTSRNRFSLPGMIAIDLATLPPQDAERLLLEVCPQIGEHAADLAKLCGYLPLALRLSASLLANSSRSVSRYLDQLRTERLKNLLDPDNPGDPQVSIEESLRLSYELLEPSAQQMLCQLSVFPASFDTAAIRAVVEVDRDIELCADTLQRRSLLEWDTASERFSLHELVREFGALQLENADVVRLRHAQYYAKVAAHAENNLYLNGKVLEGLALFDQERPHIDAGWDWARAHNGDPSADVLLQYYADATANIGDLRYDKRRERIPQLEAALAAAQRRGRRDMQGILLGNLGLAYADLGKPRRAIDFYQQRIKIARELGDRRGEGAALSNLGNAHADLGEPRRAIDFYRRVPMIMRELGDRRGEGAALGNLGNAYAALGQPRRAIDFYQQHLAVARELGDRRGEGAALSNLGSAYAALGEVRRAIDFYQQVLAIMRELGDRRGEGAALGNLGNAYVALGEPRRAIGFYQQHLAVAREIGDRQSEAETNWNYGLALVREGQTAVALAPLEASLAFFRAISHPRATAMPAMIDHIRQHGTLPDTSEQDAFLATLSTPLREAIGRGDSAALQDALAIVPPDHAAAIVAQLEQAGIIGTERGSDMHQVAQEFLPLLGDIALAADGDSVARALAEAALPQLEADGWRLADAAQRIWVGERDAAALTATIDPNSAVLVNRILSLIADGPGMILVAGSLQIANLRQRSDAITGQVLAGGDAAQRADLAARLEDLSQQAEQQPGEPWRELAAHLRELARRLSGP